MIAGWPETTILRGKIVVDRGEFLAAARGTRIPRKIADAIRSRPAA
jgi:hypothetical protein